MEEDRIDEDSQETFHDEIDRHINWLGLNILQRMQVIGLKPQPDVTVFYKLSIKKRASKNKIAMNLPRGKFSNSVR